VIFPDGIANAQVALQNGNVVDRDVTDNAIFASFGSQAVSVSWTDASGHSHSQVLGAGQRCPQFQPLPADALDRASAVALGGFAPADHARVTRVKRLERGDRGGYLYGRCGAATASRGVLVELHIDAGTSASMAKVSLLLGRIDGRMQVWERLH
jgi:hypothetical protein